MALVRTDSRACAVVFSGQGAQTPHMGKLHHRFLEVFRLAYSEAGEVLGLDFLTLGEGTGADFQVAEIVQPLLVAHGVASWRALAEAGLRPRWVAGHSLGEIAALVAAEAIDFETALRFARERGRAMGACPPGGMRVVVGLDAHEVTAWCERHGDGEVALANRNLPDQTVISGSERALPAVVAALEEAGAVVQPVRVSLAAHSSLMAGAEERLERFAGDLKVHAPSVPVLSTLTGEALVDAEDVRANLSRAMTRSVDWVAVVAALRRSGVEQVIECGPRTVLRDLVRAMAPDVAAASVVDADGLALLGISVEETDTRAFAQRALRLVVGTPRRSHDMLAMAATVEAFARLQQVVDSPESSGPDDVRRLLDEALAAKGFDLNTRTRLVAERRGAVR